MLMAEDEDGSHIKALVINFFYCFWPELLNSFPGFLCEFITPIIRATKGDEVISFFCLPEYHKWRAENKDSAWRTKYYKGLGTNTAKEAKEYFSNLSAHKINFVWKEGDGDAIEKAFARKRAEDRREWIINYENAYVDYRVKELSYTEFIDKELVRFSIADCRWSIPSLVDGFKPGQRKILYACIKRAKEKRNKEIRVAQLCGYVSEVTSYHHGECALGLTIIGMAQNYVGSNNINLLYPAGCFGTRWAGGKDYASTRYIFTKLCDVARFIFRPEDDSLLNYLEEDGFSIEPDYYIPIIPMVLVNGADGIGRGWSTTIPPFNPLDVIQSLKRMLKGEEPIQIAPWFANFKGTVIRESAERFVMKGCWHRPDGRTLCVTELPADMNIGRFHGLLDASKEYVENYVDSSTENNISITINLTQEGSMLNEAGIEHKFKLASSLSLSNMILHNAEGRITKYQTPVDILKEFYALRIRLYARRKQCLLNVLKQELDVLSEKLRFMLLVASNQLIVYNQDEADVILELEREGFLKCKTTATAEQGYDYLLSIPLRGFTKEAISQLMNDIELKKIELESVAACTEEQLYATELDSLTVELLKMEAYRGKKETKENVDQGVTAQAVTIHLYFNGIRFCEYRLCRARICTTDFDKGFVLKYEDDEQDFISMHTQEELEEALRVRLNLDGGVLRVHVIQC